MRPINIYTLTRIAKAENLQRLERQMSKRGRCLKIKEWEIEGIRDFAEQIYEREKNLNLLQFFYSFVMPKLGKEFDLLRVSEDYVVNIELKSGGVSDDTIKNQLLQNQYYLATLGKSIYSYTYISGPKRLVKLSKSGHLREATFEELVEVLQKQKECYEGPIEALFQEDKYLISPLTDPGRFLRQEYFLTSQQKDIKRQILKKVSGGGVSFQGFTGLPGTGKTILLYDIAMKLSNREAVCVFHYGSHAKELEQLDDRLKRVDFYYCESGFDPELTKQYAAILVDEGHRINQAALDCILKYARSWQVPVIFSYDCEEVIAKQERGRDGSCLIEELPGFEKYHLTNRIRVNAELSSFIHCVMHVERGNHRMDFPSVALAYANQPKEAEILLQNYEREGYIFIRDGALNLPKMELVQQMGSEAATCKEFDKVVMVMDASFWYDEKGYLRYEGHRANTDSGVRNLFHGLSRAKEGVALLIIQNEPVFETLLSIVQKPMKDKK